MVLIPLRIFLKDLLDVPSNLLNFWDDTIVGFIESVESKFTFIEESKSNIQLIIDRLTSMSKSKTACDYFTVFKDCYVKIWCW